LLASPSHRVEVLRAAWAAAGTAAVGCAIAAVVVASGRSPVVAPTAATLCMFLSLVLPCVSIAAAVRGDVRAWTRASLPVIAGSAISVTAFGAAGGLPVAARALQSLAATAAAACAFAALAQLASRLTRSPTVAGVLASLALVFLTAVPFWSGASMRAGVALALGTVLIGASPYLASALPWVSPAGGWAFDPRTSAVLYDIWVGTDVPISYPAWWSCVVGNLVVAALLAAAGLLPAWWRHIRSPGASASP
jgi:hypothetical protein